MYTNRGMLAMMKLSDITHNYEKIQEMIMASEKGVVEIDKALFDDLARWEQDIHAHIVNMAEHIGRTNVCNSAMKL